MTGWVGWVVASVFLGATAYAVPVDEPTPAKLRERVATLLAAGDVPGALGAATQLVARGAGDDPDDLLLLARTSYYEALRRIGEGEAGGGITDALWFDATDAASRAANLPSGRVSGGTFLGFVLVQRGKFDEAIDALDKVLTEDAAAADALALRGFARSCLGQVDPALVDLDAALARLPDRFEIKVHRARAIAQRSLADGAKELEALASDPGVDDAFAGDVAAILEPRPDLALAVLRKVTERHATPSSVIVLARMLIQAGDPAAATAVLNEAITEQPDNGSLRAWRAEAARRANVFDRGYVDDLCYAARADCDEATWAHSLLNLSVGVFVERNDWESARRMCEVLVGLEERSRVSLANLALTLRNLGRVDEGGALYRELLERWPEDASGWNDYGLLLSGTGRAKDAAEAFSTAAELGNIDATENLGMLRLAAGHTDAARKNFLDVLRRDPSRVRSGAALMRLSLPEGGG
ncbi:MAG: tetratricopeptide repeat protein [Planctomycetes bacterium]|nr:tetratricopeptide repeat protein [Planctomycetota bacterium]MCC7170672.1 tetratricopeptide repeat protein [Planctomycetota bacterium]